MPDDTERPATAEERAQMDPQTHYIFRLERERDEAREQVQTLRAKARALIDAQNDWAAYDEGEPNDHEAMAAAEVRLMDAHSDLADALAALEDD